MGLLSNILGTNSAPTKLTKEESFLGVLLSAIAADGYVSDDESDDFKSIVFKSKLLSEMSDNQYNQSIDKLLKILKRDGAPVLVDLAIQYLPEELRLGTFIIACDLLFSDGSIEKEEEEILDQIQLMMEINDADAMKAVEVISIKNSI